MVALTPWTSLIEADQRGGLVHMFGRTLILILVALLALGALSLMAFTPNNIAITQNDEVVERDDSYDLYGVSDDDDDSGNAPTTATRAANGAMAASVIIRPTPREPET
jgi:hypothetical protein